MPRAYLPATDMLSENGQRAYFGPSSSHHVGLNHIVQTQCPEVKPGRASFKKMIVHQVIALRRVYKDSRLQRLA
ncbi:MAG: hypothetical protein BSOLF_0197 [Candidatus Carbobacillus altaicus]|uniref:Uncharacterized protein n=1 Tax=Candidatus Carbonibacillus altaicus TaxID=2163959 RepID=A0A2R6Y1E6_9BACL|nr:MAG: hypothetical protein BSOLF_0197 [Candidatus Carbobacillus altaicus]